MNKEVRAWLILIAWVLIGTSPVMYAASRKNAEPTEVTVEPLDICSTENIQPEQFYDVPLSEELQLHIFEECKKYNIAPALIIAMIERESNFDTNTVSPHGAKGLMQIVPKWNKETMDELGCSDLLDPYQNITVGVAIVAELKDKNPELYWVLMAYNGGELYANINIANETYSDYAVEVTERAAELEAEYEYLQNLVE